MDKIVLGSGKLYIDEFTGTLPADAEIEVEGKLLGYIQGGATLNYTPTFYEAKDDLGIVSKKIITEEEAVLKSGVMTWNGTTLKKLTPTARVTEDKATKTRTVKIGGLGNNDGKKYVLHFVHEDKTDGDVRITIVGSNEAGLELTFAKDKETVINAEFKAQPHDNDGTLILFKETDASITADASENKAEETTKASV